MLFPIIDFISGFEGKTIQLSFSFLLLFGWLFTCFVILSLLLFFVCYELLIIQLFLMLFLFIPSYYRIRTAFFLLLFSVVGSVSFISSIIMLVVSTWLVSSLIIIIPFYIKLPCFPFYYWLPEVHCEVNTSISLFLAGVLLKLGIYGILRFIYSSFYLSIGFGSSVIISVSIVGLIIISCSCFRFMDLKKIIALSSILHLNLTLVSIYSCSSIGLFCGIITSISHGYSSLSLFLFAGCLINKTYSRYIDSFFFIDVESRGIFLLLLIANLSFPGSLNFVSEIVALISITFFSTFICFLFLLANIISFIYWFLLFNRRLIYRAGLSSLNWIEYLLYYWFLGIIFYSGIMFLIVFWLLML
jgi:NADH:ubiquinone oxidoreductase subunit 4 (subunit M)